MLEVVFNDNGAAAELGAMVDKTRRPVAMLKVLGRRGANELKRHFRAKDRVGNRRGVGHAEVGGRRTHFWRQVADSVNSPVLVGDGRVRIAITHPHFAQKVYGGPITPKRAGSLTIPVHQLAHGVTTAVFQRETGIQLFRLRKKGGGMSNLLAGLTRDDKFEIFYVLTGRVDQEADPEALPPRAAFNAAILEEATKFLLRETAARRPAKPRGTS